MGLQPGSLCAEGCSRDFSRPGGAADSQGLLKKCQGSAVTQGRCRKERQEGSDLESVLCPAAVRLGRGASLTCQVVGALPSASRANCREGGGKGSGERWGYRWGERGKEVTPKRGLSPEPAEQSSGNSWPGMQKRGHQSKRAGSEKSRKLRAVSLPGKNIKPL